MDPIALILLILCPLAWSAFDFLRKRLAALGRATPVTLLLALVQLPVVAAWAVVDTAADAARLPAAGYWLPALGSLAVAVLGTLAFQRSVEVSELSAVVPLLSLTPVFASGLGIWLLGEVPSGRQWLGVTLVVLGVLVMGVGDRWRLRSLVQGLRREPGSGPMILAALLFATAPLFDKRALSCASMSVHATFVIAGVVLALGLWLLATHRLGELRVLLRRPRLLAAGAAVSLLAFALQLAAIQRLWVGLLETVKRATGATMALLLGALLLGETLRPPRIAAVALMVVGVAWVMT